MAYAKAETPKHRQYRLEKEAWIRRIEELPDGPRKDALAEVINHPAASWPQISRWLSETYHRIPAVAGLCPVCDENVDDMGYHFRQYHKRLDVLSALAGKVSDLRSRIEALEVKV